MYFGTVETGKASGFRWPHMAILLNYNGTEIHTTETDAESLRDSLVAMLDEMKFTMFRVETTDGPVYLLVTPQTSLIMRETDSSVG